MYMRYLRLTRIFLLLLGLAASNLALAEKIQVISADPDTAVQGTMGLDIKITGKGFDKTVDEVKFLLPCPEDEEEPCSDDTGGITVNTFKVRGSKKIIANIDISDTADVTAFDIEVSSSIRGRGGKGTTLFSVQAKKDVYDCSEVFILSDGNNCDCTFTVQDKTDQKGTPPLLIWAMQSNCTTSETLVIEQFEALSSDTNTNAILRAEAPFDGSAVIAARGHRANIFNFNIHIDRDVNAGCGLYQLNSAISFVLDSSSSNTSEESPYRNTRWGVSNSTITSDAPLCHAMEFSRMPDYVPVPDTIEGRVNIHSNVIIANSDIGTGILFRGFGPVNTFLSVSRNTIIGTAAAANAIQFGPIFGAGTVERNLIRLDGGAGVGVLVMGDGATTDVTVNQNEVTGAFIAVLVDDQVADVTLKSNILTGDGDRGTDDIGVCTDAANNTIRANKIKDFDHAVLKGRCTAD